LQVTELAAFPTIGGDWIGQVVVQALLPTAGRWLHVRHDVQFTQTRDIHPCRSCRDARYGIDASVVGALQLLVRRFGHRTIEQLPTPTAATIAHDRKLQDDKGLFPRQ
jgi:hypothetical protein